nr:MAG TPA: hypothetical protein [Bacteriophage sp.]
MLLNDIKSDSFRTMLIYKVINQACMVGLI